MKSNKFIKSSLQSTLSLLLLMIFINVQAVEIIPRIGIAGGLLWTEDNIAANFDTENGAVTAFGPNGGIVFAMKDSFMDVSFDALKYDKEVVGGTDYNMPNKGWRSELNFTYGQRLRENIYVFAGYRQVGWDASMFGNAQTTQKGTFVGLSLSNLELGSDLVSFSLGQVFGKYNSPEGTADAEGFLFKASSREKGSNVLWSIKWSQVGTLINDIPLTFGYTYLFY